MRFSEKPHAGLEIAYEGELLHEERSEFQLIQVYEHPAFGRMLVLDGLVQTSERDEFFYHEMLVHVPLLMHPDPKSVLIIGAGDGGALRRVLEHPNVERVLMCEIDRRVTEVSKEHLPSIPGHAFDDPRAEVIFEDGRALVDTTTEHFDAIIVDSSDPVGPGIVLFQTDFYQACARLLTNHGFFTAQTGSPILMPEELRMVATNAAPAFPLVAFYLGVVPTYPGTQWSYVLGSRSLTIDRLSLSRRAEERKIATRYWTPDVHVGAFALPDYVQVIVGGGKGPLEPMDPLEPPES